METCMIQCDNCDLWYHTKCVIQHSISTSTKWYCTQIPRQKILKAGTTVIATDKLDYYYGGHPLLGEVTQY